MAMRSSGVGAAGSGILPCALFLALACGGDHSGAVSREGGVTNPSGGSGGASGGSSGAGGSRPETGGSSAGRGGTSGGATSTGGKSSERDAGGSSARDGGNAPSDGGNAQCADPLRTGLTPPTGDDDFDCAILAATAKYGEPDAMIFKAIIHTESRFAVDATACPNLPCGTPTGWTQAESYCYGLMQVVPACGGTPNQAGLLPNGHPNLTTDMSSPEWPTSIFNPSVNIDIGVAGVADNRRQEQQKFAGCTQDQYTLMAIGDYNSYGSTKSCTVYNTAYDDAVLTTYRQYAQAAKYPAHAY